MTTEIVLAEIKPDGTLGSTHQFVKPSVKIGKLSSSDLTLNHPSVGRMHATIDVQDGRATVIDLGSIQGTYINDQKINRGDIMQGDRLKFGEVQLIVAEIKTTPIHVVPDNASEESAEESTNEAPRDIDSLKARIDQLKRVAEMRQQFGQPTSPPTSSPIADLLRAVLLSQLAGTTDMADKINALTTLIGSVCDHTQQLRESMPADRVATEIDGLIDLFVPALRVLSARGGELTDYTEGVVTRGVEFRAGLVKKLKTEYGLTEDVAMAIVTAEHAEMKEQLAKITGSKK